jgi:hypothetical protein
MKKLAVGLLLLVLVGCAHRTTTIDVHNLDRSDVVVVTDLRPAHEKENRTFSVSVTNEAYGIYRKGDGTLEPPMMRLLQHRVFEKFGEPQQVIVHHMVVYRNAAAGFRQAAAVGAVGGVAGAGLASGRPQLDSAISTLIFDRAPFDALAEKEHRRAFYSQPENPGRADVYVVYIDGEINGKRVFVRTISPDKAWGGKGPHAAAVESAMEYFLAQF